jgi:hypothetical protein
MIDQIFISKVWPKRREEIILTKNGKINSVFEAKMELPIPFFDIYISLPSKRSFRASQWQIESLRRCEIPESMQQQQGFAPLGPVEGKVKNRIFGENSAKLYAIDPAAC